MEILVVSATSQEIAPLLKELKIDQLHTGDIISGTDGNFKLDLLVSGVGLAQTAFRLGVDLVAKQYDLAVNLGIAGSFDRSINLGDVVLVSGDRIGDLGSEDKDGFLDAEELSLASSEEMYFSPPPGVPEDFLREFPKCEAISVNKVHGREDSIRQIVKKYKPQIESMEGAAFFMACTQTGTPCIQLRGISNYVENRNKDTWEMELAIQNLSQAFIRIYKLLTVSKLN